MATGFHITPNYLENPQSETPKTEDRTAQELATLRSQLERQSAESARSLQEMNRQQQLLLQQLQAQQQVQQPPSQPENGNKPKTMDDMWNEFWGGGTQQKQPDPPKPQQPAKAVPPVDPKQFVQQQVKETIQEINYEHMSMVQAEQTLAKRFQKEYPDLAYTHGPQITAMYQRYKGLHPNLSLEDRYALVANDAKALFGEDSKSQVQRMMATGGGQMRGGTGGRQQGGNEFLPGWKDTDKVSDQELLSNAEKYRETRNQTLAKKRGDDFGD